MYNGSCCFNMNFCAHRCISQGSLASVVVDDKWIETAFSDFEKFLWIFLILYCFGSMRILTISAAETRWKAVIMNYTEQLTGTIESKGTGDLLCQSYLQHCNQFGNILSVFIWLLQLHTSKNTCRMMPPHSKLIQSRLYIFSN